MSFMSRLYRSIPVPSAPRTVLGLVVCVALALAVGASPALALESHVPSGSFGAPGSGPGQFEDPVALAVNDSTELTQPAAGDVYVADYGNRRVERFSATGAYLGQFNGTGAYEDEEEVVKTKTGPAAPSGQFTPYSLAVDSSGVLGDPSAGDVYVLDTAYEQFGNQSPSSHNVIDKFSASGEYEGQLTGTCESTCPGSEIGFSKPFAVAVDSAGDLWVAEGREYDPERQGREHPEPTKTFVSEFSDTGGFIKRIGVELPNTALRGGNLLSGLAVDGESSLYEISVEGPLKINPDTGLIEYNLAYVNGISGNLSRLGRVTQNSGRGVAFSPSTGGLLFAEAGEGGSISEYATGPGFSSTPSSTFGTGDFANGWEGTMQGIAVSAAGTVYVTEPETDRVLSFVPAVLPNITAVPASQVAETTATLNGVVNPSGVQVTSCEFEYVAAATYGENYGNEVQTLTLVPFDREFSLSYESEATGLLAYDASAGEVQSALEALGSVGEDNVRVTGSVGGPYTIEFTGALGHKEVPQLTVGPSGAGTVTSSEGGDGGFHAATDVPCAKNPGAGSESVAVASEELTGLTPGTEYDFRLHLVNGQGPTTGEVQSFKTLAPLVVSGESFSGVGSESATLSAEVNSGGRQVSYRFEYGTTEGYGSATGSSELSPGYAATPVHVQVNGLAPETLYHFRVVAEEAGGGVQDGVDTAFSTFAKHLFGLPDDRGYEMVSALENEEANVNLLAGWPEVGEAGQYDGLYRAAADGDGVMYLSAATNGGTGNNGNEIFAARSAGGGWTQRNVTPYGVTGAHFDSVSEGLESGVISSFQALVPGAPAPKSNTEPNFYVWEAGGSGYQLLPGRFVEEAAEGGAQLVEQGEPGHEQLYEVREGVASPVGVLPEGRLAATSTLPAAHGTVSSDGSRVVWESEGLLYLRDMETGESVQLDAEAGGKGGGLWGASADDSRVYFTNTEPLTSKSTAVRGKPDLYECVIAQVAGKLSCQLSDLTKEPIDEEEQEHANVRGVLGVSPDGEYVYFVAAGVLAPGASKQECSTFEATLCNLYLYHDGETRFVAALSSQTYEDRTDWEQFEAGDPRLGETSQVSASGGLVFMSNQSLTGYDNYGGVCVEPSLQQHEPGPCEEIYVYDPSGAGSFACASCRPSGEPPSGGGGSVLPSDNSTAHPMRWISEDGARVFFDSGERLVPSDENGKEDVYEWERDGSGSCQKSPGCVYLLSSGGGATSSYLLDASASGDDVFIISRDPLVELGQATDYDVYDARVEGGSKPIVAAACTGTGCQGLPGAPPTFATPSSVTFNGVGNFPAPAPALVPKSKPKAKSVKCKKGEVRKGTKCVKKKTRKRKSKAKKSAHINRRASR